MSITLFIVGFGTYIGSSWEANLDLSTGFAGNRAVLIAFVIPTVFVLLMYGHLMGLKDRELVTSTDAKTMGEQSMQRASSADDVEAVLAGKDSHVTYVKAKSLDADVSALRATLQAAANAQRQCAKANELVAEQYESLLRQLK